MTYHVDPHSEVPPSKQIVQQVLDAIARADLGQGDRLPSVRCMAALALINPNTVGKAYRELEMLGVVQGRNGSGVFVTDRGPRIAKQERGRATLAEFERSLREAISAGHEAASLKRVFERVVQRPRIVRRNRRSAAIVTARPFSSRARFLLRLLRS